MPFAVADHDGVLTLTLDTPGLADQHLQPRHRAPAHRDPRPRHAGDDARDRLRDRQAEQLHQRRRPAARPRGADVRRHRARQHARRGTPIARCTTAPVPTIAVVQRQLLRLRRRVRPQLRLPHRHRHLRDPVLHDRAERLPVHPAVRQHLESPGDRRARRRRRSAALGRALGRRRRRSRAAWSTRSFRTLHGGAQVRRFVRARAGGHAHQPPPRARCAGALPRTTSWRAARQRIAALPPQYHEVYGDAPASCWSDGARQTRTYVEHQQPRAAPLRRQRARADRQGGLRVLLPAPDGRASAPPGASPARRRRRAVSLRGRRRGRAPAPSQRDLAARRVSPASPDELDAGPALRRSGWSARTRRRALPPPPVARSRSQVSIAAGHVRARRRIYAPTYRGGGRLVELAIPRRSAATDGRRRSRAWRARCSASASRSRARRRAECFVSRSPADRLPRTARCASSSCGGDAGRSNGAPARAPGSSAAPRRIARSLCRGVGAAAAACARAAWRGLEHAARRAAVADGAGATTRRRRGDADAACVLDALVHLAPRRACWQCARAARGARPQHRRPDRARAARLPAPPLQPRAPGSSATGSPARSTATRGCRAGGPTALDTARAFAAGGRELYR